MIDMFDTIMNLVKEWNVTGICLRLVLATFVGVIIGLDREYKNKGAGIKTHALVCIGAAMAMIVNEYVFREFPNMNTDITRLGAQVISGIGFLGVGTIMMNGRSEVKGLTTAAGLWACAGVGLAAFLLILISSRLICRDIHSYDFGHYISSFRLIPACITDVRLIH